MLLRSCLGIALFCLTLSAQVDQASLNGTVTDSSRAVIEGAKIEVFAPSTGFRRQTTSGAGGAYQLPAFPVGSFNITISRQGFRAAEFKNVELAVGQPRTIDAQLSVGLVTEAVEVDAPLETLNRTSAEVGGLIEAAQIKELPVSGRNWASLMMLAPGAINYSDGSQRSITMPSDTCPLGILLNDRSRRVPGANGSDARCHVA
jgi:hypothetical protein